MPKSIHLDHHDTATSICITVLVASPDMKERSTNLSYHVSSMKEFAHILKIPGQEVCVYTPDWPISSLQYVVDPHPDIYPPPHEDPSLIRDALFYERTQPKTQKEVILSENAVSLTGNKDHPNACLCYMLYCLAIEKPFNLAYYIANQMVSVTKSADMTLPYEMLLTWLFEHVRTNHPYTIGIKRLLDDLKDTAAKVCVTAAKLNTTSVKLVLLVKIKENILSSYYFLYTVNVAGVYATTAGVKS
ncbi:hypothetical protein Tco_0575872 [Tanacetum coccineum]